MSQQHRSKEAWKADFKEASKAGKFRHQRQSRILYQAREVAKICRQLRLMKSQTVPDELAWAVGKVQKFIHQTATKTTTLPDANPPPIADDSNLKKAA